MKDQYIYTEPDFETREVYLDQSGQPHLDRDAAIVANIRNDLEIALKVQLCRAFPDHADERDFMARALVAAIAAHRNPLRETIRALIEATD